jgi:hypothetical protein
MFFYLKLIINLVIYLKAAVNNQFMVKNCLVLAKNLDFGIQI